VAKTSNNSSTIPLDDSRWWWLGETLKYCRSHPLFRLQDLADAVDQGQVRSKVEYLDRSARPAKRIALLLTSEYFQREAAIIPFWNTLALKDRTVESRERRPYVLSFWSPDIKKFWPDRIAAEASDVASSAVVIGGSLGVTLAAQTLAAAGSVTPLKVERADWLDKYLTEGRQVELSRRHNKITSAVIELHAIMLRDPTVEAYAHARNIERHPMVRQLFPRSRPPKKKKS